MFNFEYQEKRLEVLTDGCFEPNLTTKIMLSGAIKLLGDERGGVIHNVIELGCGCGIISTYLLKYGFFSNVSSVGMSDISSVAVEVAKTNIQKHRKTFDVDFFQFRIGSGLKIWRDFDFELVINDISAVSDKLLPMTSWFNNAPNGAGVNGIENTVNVLHEFNELAKAKSVMLIPVLSLSNIELLKSEISRLNLSYQILTKQEWPLPKKMVENYSIELKQLRELGHINFVEKFGIYVAETACYRVWKG